MAKMILESSFFRCPPSWHFFFYYYCLAFISFAGGESSDNDSYAEIRLRPEEAPEGDSLASRASDAKGEEGLLRGSVIPT